MYTKQATTAAAVAEAPPAADRNHDGAASATAGDGATTAPLCVELVYLPKWLAQMWESFQSTPLSWCRTAT